MIGSETRVKVVKNKVAPPFKQAEFRLMFGEGISHEGEILQLGTDAKLITKSGAWYSYGHEKLDNGKDKSIQYLKDNPVLANKIEQAIRESHFEPTFSRLQNEDEPENHEVIPLDG